MNMHISPIWKVVRKVRESAGHFSLKRSFLKASYLASWKGERDEKVNVSYGCNANSEMGVIFKPYRDMKRGGH